MAGLDGIESTRSIRATRSTRTSTPSRAEEAKGIPTMPGSLDEALRELEADHEFLLQGGVFTRTDRLVDRLQARERHRSDAAATASARVRAVLRRLIVESGPRRGPVGCEAGGASRFPVDVRSCGETPMAVRPRRVFELMNPDVVTLRPDHTLVEAQEILASKSVSGAPVVDASGRILGVVSQNDLVRKAAHPDTVGAGGPVLFQRRGLRRPGHHARGAVVAARRRRAHAACLLRESRHWASPSRRTSCASAASTGCWSPTRACWSASSRRSTYCASSRNSVELRESEHFFDARRGPGAWPRSQRAARTAPAAK